MLPPKGPGARVVMASRSGATASVPMNGIHGSEMPSSSFQRRSSFSCQIQTLSSRGDWRVRVTAVEVRPPK